ncbi:hypothetical protein PVAND_014795 [Polypedilum vanderplanki]|uniref:Uncharacterized protein n=1 Tax=Polypedilum vanderplanki TaxID=319348 RepID=A0A9J6BA87_POLVA|nr:hypothetical protein PVAND_014795 [Polypedilum vanderplanki]
MKFFLILILFAALIYESKTQTSSNVCPPCFPFLNICLFPSQSGCTCSNGPAITSGLFCTTSNACCQYFSTGLILPLPPNPPIVPPIPPIVPPIPPIVPAPIPSTIVPPIQANAFL